MRAITGAVLSSKPCSLAKAARILALFADSAASHLHSSDAATYLRTAIEATNDHHIFRRDLRRYQQQGGNIGEGVERDGSESVKKHKRHRLARDEDGQRNAEVEENSVMVLAAGSQGASGENKSKKKESAKEDEKPRDEKQGEDEGRAALHSGLHSPASEKRKKKKKGKHETGNAEEESRKALDDGLQEEVDKEKKVKKKKKKHLKQEEEARYTEEVEQKMIHAGAADHGVANREKKRKRVKHTDEAEEKKEKVVTDGDLGSDKKRKKKRGRGDDNGNDKELVEHTKKKQRKHSEN